MVVFTFIQVKCSVYAHRLVHWTATFKTSECFLYSVC